jgi:hypothetical protein
MPSTIPYDPSLTLGSIVPPEKLDNIIKIAEIQAPADAAEAELNSYITLKRSIDMTIQEMINMGVTVEEVQDIINDSDAVKKQVLQAAGKYAKAKLYAEKQIAPLKGKIIAVSKEIESPIDYNRSILKQMPLSADSLQMNVQYFSYDENKETSRSHAATVAAFVSASLTDLGQKMSAQAAASAGTQVNSQHTNHSIAGTLVICITCTHKTAQVFAPFILDVDKAVRAWNKLFPSDMIKTNDAAAIGKIEEKMETADEKSFSMLSGATYGSSFVGMVHILNTTRTTSSQEMESIAASLQATLDLGAWVEEGTGGFGVDSSFSQSAKDLLSIQNIQSHCSAVTMGIIPSIKSNQVKMGVQQFVDIDPANDMKKLAQLQGVTAAEKNTISKAADAARTGQQMVTLETAKIEAVLSGLSLIDDGQNKIIDTNSMMIAMEDYIDKCIKGGNNVGVPINYFLKPITQAMIAQAWLAKYHPNKFNQAGSADDSNDTPATPTTTNPPPANNTNPPPADNTNPPPADNTNPPPPAN